MRDKSPGYRAIKKAVILTMIAALLLALCHNQRTAGSEEDTPLQLYNMLLIKEYQLLDSIKACLTSKVFQKIAIFKNSVISKLLQNIILYA